MKNFLQIFDLSQKELLNLLDRAEFFRHEKNTGKTHSQILHGKNIVMFFEKPSLRTKVSFEAAVSSLGGNAITVDGREVSGSRESIADIASVLTRYADGIFARVFEHSVLQEFCEYSTIPIMNALCNDHHPFQALADLQTIKWHFGEQFLRKKVVFVGDGCNVPTSLAQGCALLGMDFEICTPKGYEIPEKFWTKIVEIGTKNEAKISVSHIPKKALENGDVVVTDTWVSMGLEAEKEKRLLDFAGFGITKNVMQKANADAIFLHCLPAYRGKEVSAEVIDGKQSKIFDEAECRMHTAKAVLEYFYQ